MAGVRWKASNSVEQSTGVAKRCLLQVKAPANQRLQIDEVEISFKGVNNIAAPILVTFEIQSDKPTGSDVVTPVKTNQSDGETLQTTAAELFDGSDQPAVVATLYRFEVHPQGARSWQAPFGKEIPVKGGQYFGVTVTAEDAVSALVDIGGVE